jgi:hypothetical protein
MVDATEGQIEGLEVWWGFRMGSDVVGSPPTMCGGVVDEKSLTNANPQTGVTLRSLLHIVF